MRSRILIPLAVGLLYAQLATADAVSDLAHQMLGQTQVSSALSDTDIAGGLRQALAKGTHAAVMQLGHTDGFWGSDRYRIELPETLKQAGGILRAAGYGSKLDELHLSMNRAAEKAVPLAADVFAEAAQKLTINDARAILTGPPDAATQYFKRSTSDTLTARFRPVVTSVTAEVGLVKRYDQLVASAGPAASFLGDKADINTYITRKALDALFSRVADEEKSIRSNPAARTTDLLRKVFGGG